MKRVKSTFYPADANWKWEFQTVLTYWKLWSHFVYLANFSSCQQSKGGVCSKTLYFLTPLLLETLAIASHCWIGFSNTAWCPKVKATLKMDYIRLDVLSAARLQLPWTSVKRGNTSTLQETACCDGLVSSYPFSTFSYAFCISKRDNFYCYYELGHTLHIYHLFLTHFVKKTSAVSFRIGSSQFC